MVLNFRIHELHLSLNVYNRVEIEDGQTYPQIKMLHVNGNQLSEWSELSKLGKAFPELETLIMAENPVKTIDTSEIAGVFPK